MMMSNLAVLFVVLGSLAVCEAATCAGAMNLTECQGDEQVICMAALQQANLPAQVVEEYCYNVDCADGEVLACDGATCVDATMLGDGVCDELLDCHEYFFDNADCDDTCENLMALAMHVCDVEDGCPSTEPNADCCAAIDTLVTNNCEGELCEQSYAAYYQDVCVETPMPTPSPSHYEGPARKTVRDSIRRSSATIEDWEKPSFD